MKRSDVWSSASCFGTCPSCTATRFHCCSPERTSGFWRADGMTPPASSPLRCDFLSLPLSFSCAVLRPLTYLSRLYISLP